MTLQRVVGPRPRAFSLFFRPVFQSFFPLPLAFFPFHVPLGFTVHVRNTSNTDWSLASCSRTCRSFYFRSPLVVSFFYPLVSSPFSLFFLRASIFSSKIDKLFASDACAGWHLPGDPARKSWPSSGVHATLFYLFLPFRFPLFLAPSVDSI